METIQVAHGGTTYRLNVKEMYIEGSDTLQYWTYDADTSREIYRLEPTLDENDMPGWKWIAFNGAMGMLLPDQDFVNAIGDAIERQID